MTQRDLALVACRMLALYLLMLCLGSAQWLLVLLLSFVPMLSQALGRANYYSNTGAPALYSLFSGTNSIVYAMAAIFLWIYAPTIARLMETKDSGTTPSPGLNAPSLQAIGFSLIGLWLLCQGLPRLLSTGFYGWFYLGMYQQRPNTPEMDIASAFVTTVLGLILVMQARRLSFIIWRVPFDRRTAFYAEAAPPHGAAAPPYVEALPTPTPRDES